MPNRVLKAGWAEATLPDGVGLDLSGFLARENPSVGQRDPLRARVLWLDDGVMFGVEGSMFMRFNIACPRAMLKDGLERLEKAAKQLPKKK